MPKASQPVPTADAVRAALYARVSTDEQAREGTSLDSQREQCAAYVAAKGWLLVDEFVDEGVSGTKGSRPALDVMLAAARAGQLDAIVVKKLDRFGRSSRHLENALGDLDEWGVRFVSIEESFDSSTPAGRLMRTMLGGFAQFEREQIRDRMMDGQRGMAEAGYWPAGPPPHGYEIVAEGAHKKLAINEREAEGIRLAAAVMVDEGGTVGDAAKRLNALGFRKRRGGRWDRNQLRRRLLLDHYTGTWVWKPGTPDAVPISIPPIFSEARQAALHAALANQPNVGTRKRPTFYPLSLRIVGTCGEPFSGVARNDRNGTRFYRCRNRNVHARERGDWCSEKYMRASEVEAAVWGAVCELLGQPERLLAMARDFLGVRGEQMKVERRQVDELDRRIARQERALSEKVADYLKAGVDAAAVKLATADLHGELDALRKHRATLAAWAEQNAEDSDRMRRLWELAELAHTKLATMTPEQQAFVYRLLEVRVTVLAHQSCNDCRGSGRTGGDRKGRPTCRPCHGTGARPALRVEGVIHDQLLLDAVVPCDEASDHADPQARHTARRVNAEPGNSAASVRPGRARPDGPGRSRPAAARPSRPRPAPPTRPRGGAPGTGAAR
jgi:DNA invertase Pin-like site-specific DNA recombinase